MCLLQTGQYSTQIFSLAVLLSSLFVFNQMGGIDEAALDRLSLVTEMTKHIRVRASGGKPYIKSTLLCQQQLQPRRGGGSRRGPCMAAILFLVVQHSLSVPLSVPPLRFKAEHSLPRRAASPCCPTRHRRQRR